MKRRFILLALLSFSLLFLLHSPRLEAQWLEKTLRYENEATFERSAYDRPYVACIPKEWGRLKAVTSHNNVDVLYFEDEDGNIYVVLGAPTENGQYHIRGKNTGAVKIIRKELEEVSSSEE